MRRALVIAGANTQINFETSELFTEKGFHVVNLSHHHLCIENSAHMSVDLTDTNWPHIHGDSLISLLQGVNCITLVHNAALMIKDDINADDFKKLLQLNVIASTQLNQLLLPLMNPGSSIIYIGSVLNEKTVTNTCSYVVSRHAQTGLMKATCEDLIAQGIHTACIFPGFSDTYTSEEYANDHRHIMANHSYLKSANQPDDIADTILYCSENNSINGSVIHINLGDRESTVPT